MSNIFIRKFDCYPYVYFFTKNTELLTNSLVLDMFDIFCSIYYSDIMTKHNISTNIDGRNIEITIPVYNIQVWESNKHLVEQCASFMSEDKWKINLIPRELKGFDSVSKSVVTNYTNVSLISGGLDSFCGAYFNITNDIKTLYCGYKLNTYEQHFQNDIISFITKSSNSKTIAINKIKGSKVEHTQRTRSMLFLAIACVLAQMYNIDTITLYENGILSLNPELYSRKTTKTTHPKTIYLINKMLENIGLNLKIIHPFLFKTKGEIINSLSDEFKLKISNTYTCGTSRQNPKYDSSKHCGVCIPCTLRKISLAAYDLETFDREYEIPYGHKIVSAKINQQEEYKSSNEYFKLFKAKIDNGDIYNYLDIRQKYYSTPDYLKLTETLLNHFSTEVERYYDKYSI